MNAEIIAVGSELLLGQIANTNAQFLSKSLAELGVNVYHHTVVGDNPKRLKNVLHIAEKRSNLLIFTGGLGPTKDDLTKEIIAEHLGETLTLHEAAFASIQAYFAKTKREMTPNNKKQALVITGSEVLPNQYGMAPGMYLQKEGCVYILLPGPPREMEPMFVHHAMPLIEAQLGAKEKIESRILRFFDIGESKLETVLEDLIDKQTNPTLAPLAGDGDVTIRITAKSRQQKDAQTLIDQMEEQIFQRVGNYFYGYGQTTLMDELVKLLEAKRYTIACAESLTGGMFQSELASVAGVSARFLGGVVCYSNAAKITQLNIKEETINAYGAVSEQCALEMAANVKMQLNADIGISFTGVAGPDSLEGHSPGTIWIGIAVKERPPKAFLLHLAGSRNGNRKRTVRYGCYFLMTELNQASPH